jgi:cystathionine beta-lyase/cystathionine gamma-synthase
MSDAKGSRFSQSGFGTKAIHAGQEPDPSTGAIMTPIYQTSTYVQDAPNVNKGYDYARVANPTRTALEGNLAALENASDAICFSAGVAATDAVIKSLRPGDRVIASNDLYGGSFRLFKQVYEKFGIAFDIIDLTHTDALKSALQTPARLLWFETPSNPLLRIIDLKAVCDLAHEAGAEVAVDNTFATPFLQRPIDHGVDLVMHSTTKYIGGHSDVVGGVVCTNNQKWVEDLRFQIKTTGGIPGPMDCFLLLRGTKTLHVRMERHCRNARAVASFLVDHPLVERVYYPGLQTHPGHEIARRQMDDFGGMLSFTLKGDSMDDALAVLSGTKIFSLAESLGGVESLIDHPATMTHASVPKADRLKSGLKETLIRLSVGIEDEADLIADLTNALSLVG